MAVFKNAAEVHDYVGSIFDTALQSPFGDDLAATGMVLQLDFTDPAATLVLDLPGKAVHRGENADSTPDAVLTMSGDDANRFWQGKLGMMSALAGRRIKVKGNVRALIRLQPNSAFLYEVYTDRLTRDRRHDLLEQ